MTTIPLNLTLRHVDPEPGDTYRSAPITGAIITRKQMIRRQDPRDERKPARTASTPCVPLSALPWQPHKISLQGNVWIPPHCLQSTPRRYYVFVPHPRPDQRP